MADVWVSRKKWTCQYCNVTINDDVPSRQHHESGGRHKGNVERALQSLYKKGERERKDAQAAKREMDRIERLAAQSYAKDLATWAAESSRKVESTAESQAKPPPAWKPKNKLAAYGSVAPPPQAQEQLPIEEAEPSQDAAVAGDWEEVRTAGPSKVTQDLAQPPSEREQAKSFRINEKVSRSHENDADALDLAQIKVKKRKAGGRQDESQETLPPPVWSPVPLVPSTASPDDKKVAADTKPDAAVDSVDKSDPAAPTSLFKKRKSGSGAGAKKVRAIV